MFQHVTAGYVDLDGVLADWLKAFNDANICSIEEFNKMSKQEKFDIKEKLFTYDFFRNMRPINAGKRLFNNVSANYKYVYILSAVGDSSNVDEIARAKTEWVREHICEDVEILFVDKVQNKHTAIKRGIHTHVLYDDRLEAIKSWQEKGSNMIGIHTDHNHKD